MGLAPLTTTVAPTAVEPRATSFDHDGTPPVAALTTVWTPSEGCFPVSTRSTSDIDMFWTSNPECAPPGYETYFETYYYSPAICPSGFTVGCSRYGSFQGPSVESTETAMLCVLSDYVCTPGAWNYYATNTDLEYAQIMIQIRWAESDLSTLETHPLTPGLTLSTVTSAGEADATQTGPSSGPTVTVVSTDPASPKGGLSTGAQVGIGVGVGLLGLLGIGLAIFFIWRYRKKRANSQAPPVQQPPPGRYPVHQYPFMPGPGQQDQPAAQGYSQPGYPGYTTYVDPKTGAVNYYSPVPHPTELGGTAIDGSNQTHSQGTRSVVGSQPTYPLDPTLSGSQPMSMKVSSGGDSLGNMPARQSLGAGGLTAIEMPGNEGVARSVASTESPQTQQEMAHLMAEQAKLESRRTRLMELAELDEEEQRIRTRMLQLQQTQ
ncbi:hypothetical protein F4677DRAFT_432459 [Hypoxylon crocopeplum]|nr:hypothetical protein F4677DRAFT_432459 [Hypoxylon crocopeplum]